MTELANWIAREVEPATFQMVEEICRRSFGFRLLTVLRRIPGETRDVLRVHSSNPTEYPCSTRKPMERTAWAKVVLAGGQGWWGEGEAAIRWAFPDADLMLKLGLGSCLCAPVLADGRTIAVLSLNGEAGAYRPDDLAPLGAIAQLLKAELSVK